MCDECGAGRGIVYSQERIDVKQTWIEAYCEKLKIASKTEQSFAPSVGWSWSAAAVNIKYQELFNFEVWTHITDLHDEGVRSQDNHSPHHHCLVHCTTSCILSASWSRAWPLASLDLLQLWRMGCFHPWDLVSWCAEIKPSFLSVASQAKILFHNHRVWAENTCCWTILTLIGWLGIVCWSGDSYETPLSTPASQG